MKRALLAWGFSLVLFVPSLAPAVEVAPRLTDREIIERLTRLEEGQNTLREGQNTLREGQNTLRAEVQQLRAEISQLRQEMNGQIQQLRAEMQEQVRQLRVDMNAQFDRMINLMVGVVLAFAALVAATIGFALWDRRTMIRPFESKVQEIEEEISQNRQRLHSLLEALRALSQSDDRVAEVLQRFHLL